jgi:hypothetical protein
MFRIPGMPLQESASAGFRTGSDLTADFEISQSLADQGQATL